jgi:hypothetical protein
VAGKIEGLIAAATESGPARTRTDLGGLLIETLPPPLRDHMPDRYIQALGSELRFDVT